jgi:hypothetical protein
MFLYPDSLVFGYALLQQLSQSLLSSVEFLNIRRMLLIGVAKSSDCPFGLRHKSNSVINGHGVRAEVKVKLRLGLLFILPITLAILIAIKAATCTRASDCGHIASFAYTSILASACTILPIIVTDSFPILILVFWYIKRSSLPTNRLVDFLLYNL